VLTTADSSCATEELGKIWDDGTGRLGFDRWWACFRSGSCGFCDRRSLEGLDWGRLAAEELDRGANDVFDFALDDEAGEQVRIAREPDHVRDDVYALLGMADKRFLENFSSYVAALRFGLLGDVYDHAYLCMV